MTARLLLRSGGGTCGQILRFEYDEGTGKVTPAVNVWYQNRIGLAAKNLTGLNGWEHFPERCRGEEAGVLSEIFAFLSPWRRFLFFSSFLFFSLFSLAFSSLLFFFSVSRGDPRWRASSHIKIGSANKQQNKPWTPPLQWRKSWSRRRSAQISAQRARPVHTRPEYRTEARALETGRRSRRSLKIRVIPHPMRDRGSAKGFQECAREDSWSQRELRAAVE